MVTRSHNGDSWSKPSTMSFVCSLGTELKLFPYSLEFRHGIFRGPWP